MIKHWKLSEISYQGQSLILMATNDFCKCQHCVFVDADRCPAKMCGNGYFVDVE